MRDCCGDPDSVGGSLGGTIEVPSGSQDNVVDTKNGEGVPTLEEVSFFADGNAGAGDKELQNVTSNSSPFYDSSFSLDVGNKHDVFINEVKEVGDDYDKFVEVEKETKNLEHKNRVPLLVEEMKEVEKGCNKCVLAEEETEHLHFVVDKEPFVKTPDMAEDEATTFEDAGEGARESLGVTCSICDGNGTCSSAEQRNESVDRCERLVGAIRKNQHHCIEDNMLIKGPQTVNDEHNNQIGDLSPLLTSGVVSESPTRTHIAIKVGNATGSFCEDKGHKRCNTCENVPHVSSGLAAYCHLISIDEKTAKHLESCSSLQEKSMGCANTLVGGKIEHEFLSDVEGIEYNLCKNKMLFSDTNNRGKHEPVDLQNCEGLFSSCMRSQGNEVCDHSEENSVSSEQAVDKAGFIDRRPSGGLLEEVSSCFSGEGSSFQQSPLSFTAVPAHPLDPLVAMDCKRKVTDGVNTASTCCSDVKVSDGGMVNSKSIPLIVFRRSNPKRAASLRNNQPDVKPDSITRTKNRLRKWKKSADSSISFSNITFRKPNARRKRSCFNRVARKSDWGGTDSLITLFMENNSSSDLAKIHNKSWKTSKCCRAKGKRRMAHGGMNLKLSETRSAFSTHPMHLNDTCPQPNFPVAVNSQFRTETIDDVLQNLSSPTELLIPSRHGEGDCEPSTNMLAPGEKFLQRDGQQGDKDIESTLTQDVSCENMLEECPGISSQDGSEPLVETIVKRNLLDPGSSPDSDIYNPVVDVSATPIEAGMFTIKNAGANKSRIVPEMSVLHGMSVEVLNSSEANVNLEPASSFDVQLQTGKKKGKKEKDSQTCQKACTSSDHNLIDKKFYNLGQTTATEPLKYVRQRRNGFKERNLVSSDSIKKACRKGSRKGIIAESTIPGMTNLDCSEEPGKAELGLEIWAVSEHNVRNIQPEKDRPVVSDKTKGHKISRSSKTRVGGEKSNLTDPSRRQRKKSCGQKNPRIQKSEKSRNKKKNQTLNGSHEVCGSMKLSPGYYGNELVKPKDGPCGLDCQSLQQRQAWVLCDDCHKWRCIPTALADMIEETNCRWTCKDNIDKAFADCSIPQEKTNSEINAELDISDASCDDIPKQSSARHVKSKLAASPAPWTHIKSNLYLHRNRKSQTIDETMVCHCRPSSDGCLGCGDQCLNRMLNIECVKGTCPCGELCSNQQFQKRKYARLKWIPCGKKGFGLQLLEDVSSGWFLIEYVGEVLDFATYEARQRYYASRNQKHFYFMTLNGGEVIDACAKGNLGRFINHSCEPNCRTEKWMVNGEVCIGLFAIRDIKKGEELTFDYNYVRVFGAAAKKCVCGSSVCRGFIGGDPLNTEVILQDDSDDEYLEPLIVHEDSEKTVDTDVTFSEANDMIVKDADTSMEKKELLQDCSLISETEDHQQPKDTIRTSTTNDVPFSNMGNLQVEDSISRPISDIQLLEEYSKRLDNQQPKEITSCPPSAYPQQIDIPLQPSSAGTNPISDSAVNDISASDSIDEQLTRSKSSLAKSSHSSRIIKKSKHGTKPTAPQKAKKLPVESGNTQFERVERELNELLDADGGISKRKDATRGYLKLLFVTAAEGDNIGAPSQSIRDLSLILDALLKTKSRTVLVDIINKNGLQMLHNIMKQNRSKFTRIPILRKLLKVLEFLALKEILTPEHINKGPPCSGMESFKESMLSLTRHNDIQVHQIARNFRDKWIPRTIKRVEPSDRDKMQLDTHRFYNGWFQSSSFSRRIDQGARDSDAIVCGSEPVMQQASSSFSNPGKTSAHSSDMVSSSLPLTNNNQTNGTRTRKRKSRWDQPSDYKIPDQQNLWSSQQELASEAGSNTVKNGFSDVELSSSTEVLKKLKEDCTKDRVTGSEEFLRQNNDDEVPPGFGVPQKDHLVTSETSIPRGEVGVGYPQERYLSHLSVSYGIPISLVEKLGTPNAIVGAELHQFWTVAPSMPFHPFPPLPPYPRGESKPSSVSTDSSKNSIVAQGSSETQPCKPRDLSSQATEDRPADNSEAWPRNPQITQRMGWQSNSGAANSGGRRFFRPERGNNQRFRRRWAPWPQEGSDGGRRGSVRHRDTGRSFGGERKYWPPWPQQESDISSKDHIDGDSSTTDVGNAWDIGGGGGGGGGFYS